MASVLILSTRPPTQLSTNFSRLLLPSSSSSPSSSYSQFFVDHMLLSRFVIPLILSFLALDYFLPVSRTAAEDDVPNSSAACTNCNICPYPCHPLPPPPPAAPVYGAPPPPLSPPVGTSPVQGGNCQPGGQVVPSPPANTYPYGYPPPTPPLGYTPYESRSALSPFPSLHGCLMMLLLSLLLSI